LFRNDLPKTIVGLAKSAAFGKIKLFQERDFHSVIKTYSHLPKTFKELSHDVTQFRLALK
jgi:hypothetical protein